MNAGAISLSHEHKLMRFIAAHLVLVTWIVLSATGMLILLIVKETL